METGLEIASETAGGLGAIQKQHLVHRDIKPSNIMVSLEEGRLESAKIIDLGLAKLVDNSAATGGSSIPGFLREHPSTRVRNNLAGWQRIFVLISIHWALRFGNTNRRLALQRFSGRTDASASAH